MKVQANTLALGIALLVAGVVLPAARAQGPAAGGPPPEVARAREQLGKGEVDAAIATLEALLKANPGVGAGRLLLADAYRRKGDLDRALAAYEAVPERPRPLHAQALFGAAAVQTTRGRRDEALRLLGDLAAAGTFDMDLVRDAADFASLREDPRFAAVLYAPADFLDPFVEKVKVIHEWVGEGKGDQFSWIARSLADVDGDGVREVVTSAPTYGAAGGPTGPGRVYLYSGKSGALRWTQTGQPGEGLGTGLEGAGDVDADGVADVVAGAPGSDRAYVYSGRDGELLLTLVAPQPGEQFGGAASGAGDQNGDGHADVIVVTQLATVFPMPVLGVVLLFEALGLMLLVLAVARNS
jgi:hypothetical protein